MTQDQAQAAAARAATPYMSAEEAMAKAQAGKLPGAPVSPGEQQRVEQARQFQQRAQDSLTQAAQRLKQSGQALAQAAKNTPAANPKAPPSPPVVAKDLAQSFQQAAQAGRAQDASQAASQAGQAAQSLSQMARQAAQNMGAMGNLASANSPAPDDGKPNDQAANTPASRGAEVRKSENVSGDGVPPELAKLGISQADWSRIKSSLGSETTSQATSGAPKEYRDLVSDYFRIIATEAKK